MRSLILLAFAGLALTACASEEKKIVCYYGSWATYRNTQGKFDIEDIDAKLCTHLIYSFVGIENNNVKILDDGLDINKNGYVRFNALRDQNPGLKTLVAIGGWNQGSDKFSKTASSPSSRAKFVRNVVAFVKKHKFDGFDVDWEYPAQRPGSSSADVQNFVALLKELRTAFDQEHLLLSAAVGAPESSASQSYNIAEISTHLHFINLMAYDFHGAYDGKTGMHSALYADKNGVDAKLNIDAIINYWLSHGAPKEKLILGIPTYGRSFTVSSGNNAVGSPSTGPGTAGPYTGEGGMLGYNEICEKQRKEAWQVKFDEERRVPFAYRGNQWVGYDNVKSVQEKAELAMKKGLGGVMVWAIDTDDFRGNCGEKYPLIKTLNHVVRNGNPVIDRQPESPDVPTDQSPENPNQQPENPSNNNNDGICKTDGNMPDPTTCTRFFQCVSQGDGNFIKYMTPCPSGLCYKAESGDCDYP